MPSLKSLCAFASVVAVCLQLAACGRGSNDLPPSEPPFPAASEDQLPAGQRIDVSAQNLFPMGAGDVWNYNILDAGGTQTGYDTRQVTSGPDASGRVVLTETEAGAPSTTTYVVSGDGLLLAAPLEGFAPASAASIVGSFFEYAAPLYPQGATRRHVRSGPWGEDLDGDGVGESFRLEFSQVFLGFEQVQFSNVFSLKNVAHFRNVIQLTLRPTAPGNTDRAVTVTEETWFAPNLGMLKAVRSAVDIDGVTIDPVHTIAFASATVGGVSWITSARPPILDGQVIDVPVVHNALVYDSVRNRYYASIPGSVIGNGNSIATIEPVTGQVTYSAQIGSNPNAIAISADGSLLYLGLDESGEVVKLALPSMAEVGRTTLVNDNVFGQTRAETIAVSPAEPTVVAVSMAYTGMSPRHAGVALLRDMALQPKLTPTHQAGSNLITFDSTGAKLYGLNVETSESGLRRIGVLADGLVEELMVVTASSLAPAVETRGIGFADNRVVSGHTLYDAPALEAAGMVSTPSDCRKQRSGNFLFCFNTRGSNTGVAQILVADAGTFVIQASLVYALSEPGVLRNLVEGPAGQVAISYAVGEALSSSKIRLFTSSQLLAPPAPPQPSWPITASSTPNGQVLDIGIVHNSLVYDSGRNVYYASVPGSVIGAGNSIAIINPATGQVTHSAPIGSEPSQLALAADGSVLYVGLDGSNEVLRLALPSMSAQGRVHLIADSFFGRTRAESIAVSPVDSSVAAVAMAWITSVFPHHAGDALLRDMVMQPNRTPVHTGSNLVTFDSTGDKVYGMNAEAEDGLRRLGVLADGLVEELRVTAASTGILPRAVSFAHGQVVQGGTVFDAPALTAVGTVPNVQDCCPTRSGTGLLCLNGQSGHVLVADSTTFAIGASLLFYPSGEPDFARRLVQGPAGQIGVSYIPQFSPASIRMFTSGQLP